MIKSPKWFLIQIKLQKIYKSFTENSFIKAYKQYQNKFVNLIHYNLIQIECKFKSKSYFFNTESKSESIFLRSHPTAT